MCPETLALSSPFTTQTQRGLFTATRVFFSDSVFATAMDASDEQLDFPIIYASAKEGWCVEDTTHVDPKVRKEALGPQGLDTGA